MQLEMGCGEFLKEPLKRVWVVTVSAQNCTERTLPVPYPTPPVWSGGSWPRDREPCLWCLPLPESCLILHSTCWLPIFTHTFVSPVECFPATGTIRKGSVCPSSLVIKLTSRGKREDWKLETRDRVINTEIPPFHLRSDLRRYPLSPLLLWPLLWNIILTS